MKKHLNTLFVTTDEAYLHKDGEAVDIRIEGTSKLRVPLHNLDGIVIFGYNSVVSASVLGACAEKDISISFLSPHGKFMAASRGYTSGNILLRRQQYRMADDPSATASIARNIVLAKLANSRSILQRAARDHGDKRPDSALRLQHAIDQIQHRMRAIQNTADVDEIRGYEGESANAYFACFNDLITLSDSATPASAAPMRFNGRTRRPPLDPVNALLSFFYALLMHDCRSALESCGLDPQCGFLHRDRSGRPSLALDLMEEFRGFLADRATLSMINRQQITAKDFEVRENGATMLKEDSRKKVLLHWQERKLDEIVHPLLEEKMTIGLLPHIQARLLSRHIRGDLDAYPAYVWR